MVMFIIIFRYTQYNFSNARTYKLARLKLTRWVNVFINRTWRYKEVLIRTRFIHNVMEIQV